MNIYMQDKIRILSKRTLLLAVLSMGAYILPASSALAQDKPDDYVARGLTYKGLVYSPSVVLSGQYNSNVFADKDDEKTDYIYHIQPSLSVAKQYGAFSFRFDGDADIERYVHNSSNNKEDYSGYISGGYQVNSRWSIQLNFSIIQI